MLVLLHAKSHIVADIPGFVREGVDPDKPHSHQIGGPSYADADLTAEEAGRLCYLSGHRPNPKTSVNGSYLLNICAQKHYSVLGHASASFYIETSRNTSHEIVRHRWFTFSEVSQRYVDAAKLGYEVHPGLPQESGLIREMDRSAANSKALYYDLMEDMSEAGYGVKPARQAARGVLPGNTHTKILMSGNIRAWRDFLAQRLAPGADLEIQAVARTIYRIMNEEFPNSFQDFDYHGMITTERLIRRVLARHDASLQRPSSLTLEDIRHVVNQGLWILKEDPWNEEEIEKLGESI